MTDRLYRIDLNQTLTQNDMDWLTRLQNRRVLVPVEACEHGMIPSHPVLAQLPDGEMVWTGIVCPGAGIGGDEPECEHPVVRIDDYCESCDDYMGEGAWKRAAGIGDTDGEG